MPPRLALIVTVLNEADSIDALLASVAAQTRAPDEMIVVDGGSTDGTWQQLSVWTSRLPLKNIRAPGATIARGRNFAIRATDAPLIAVTDAGVRLEPDWLAELCAALRPEVEVVSGFFVADPASLFERAMGATVLPALRDVRPATFLPSSRSVLFRRTAWTRVGGYPEWLDYCEDLVFDLALRRAGARFAFAPHAVACFRPRSSLGAFFRQYYRYARGDGKADLWRMRHAIRYLTYGVACAALARFGWRSLPWLALGGAAYCRRPYARLWSARDGLRPRELAAAAMLVPVIRLVGDSAKMLGYPVGVGWRLRHAGRSGERQLWTCPSSS